MHLTNVAAIIMCTSALIQQGFKYCYDVHRPVAVYCGEVITTTDMLSELSYIHGINEI